MIDNRKWHIYKDQCTPTSPWHIELTEHGQHCHSPNEPMFNTYGEAADFVSKHVDGHTRRMRMLAAKMAAR